MPNLLSTTWVKNVYSVGKVQGIKGVLLSPIYELVNNLSTRGVHNQPSFPLFFPAFPLSLSPPKNTISSLLISYLYPLSTHPIIKKKKKI